MRFSVLIQPPSSMLGRCPEPFEYWKEDGDQVVYIAGACSNEGKNSARAGFGTDWGPNDRRNIGWTAFGTKTALRAELSALKKALEIALSTRVRRLVVRHKSSKLAAELEKWDNTSAAQEPTFENFDLLKAIDRLKVDFEHVWIEEAEPSELAFFCAARTVANRIAGMHSSAAEPLNNEFWSSGVRVVHIAGTAIRDPLPHAGYGVYWGPEDVRNESGGVGGEQTLRSAQLTAVWAAMEQAVASDVDELVIRSKHDEIHYLINRAPSHRRFLDPDVVGRDGDLIRKIDELRPRFDTLIHRMVRKKVSRGQEKAARLARKSWQVIRTEVTTCAVEMPGGHVRYGLYYGRDDPRNESGRVSGEQTELHAEIVALKKALENAKSAGVHFLHIRFISPAAHYFATVGLTIWEKFQWKVGETESWKHHVLGRQVAKLMEEVKVTATFCSREKHVEAARSMARTPQLDKHQIVHTAGALFRKSLLNADRAGYHVFWAEDDEKNERGSVEGEQNHLRAGFKAVERALEIAIERKIARLVIRISNGYVYRTIAENLWKRKDWWDRGENKDPFEFILRKIDRLATMMTNVEYELHECDGAELMASWMTQKKRIA